jgi:multiple sugar transport system substrate-binding protein
MGPIVHESASAYEGDGSPVKGKVDWTTLPQGPQRSVTHFGGSGLGINMDSSPAKQHAAWEFITWATSTQLQAKTLKQAGGSFTRTSTWNAPEIREARNKEPWNSSIPNVAQPLRRAWQPANMGMRPHSADWNELKQTLFTEVSKAISGKSSKKAMKDLDSAWSSTLG